MKRQIFVNLSVKDLNKTKYFFSKLGFSFNPKFTDGNAACLILGEDIFAMLLKEEFFKTFTKEKEICDTKKSIEVLNALRVESKKEVDSMIENAISAGGKEFRTMQDLGWMYTRAFEDLDNHVWEVFYMNENEFPN